MSGVTNVSDAIKRADQYFTEGYNCAQAVLRALQSYCGLEDKQLWRTATGLGAGMG